jgi:ABC-type bacteriocin/lantibiotic exporter with double-glycine peptidase domain
MITATNGNCAEWFPHHFLGDSQYLGRQGVFFQQSHDDCGGAALKMILAHFGIPVEYGSIMQRLHAGPNGTTMLSLKQLAESEGLRCEGWRLNPQDLTQIPLPAVLLLRRHHFAVIASASLHEGIQILDPVRGRLRISGSKLVSIWEGETLLFHGSNAGAADIHRWFARRKTQSRW